MKTVEISKATLSEYGRKETWLLTRHGKPVAAVVPIRPGVDAETFALSHDPGFIEAINRSWRSYQDKGGIPLDEIEREFGIKPKATRRSVRKPMRKARASR
jgi:antitoxin (DNA-binding transcriptional repressor) of toxin-antitoxin stability system